MVIAIDGPAGSGKSTLAGLVAKRLGFTYINSGNLYRAITYGCLSSGIDVKDEKNAVQYAKKVRISYQKDGSVILNEKDISAFLHDDEIDKHVSALSSIIEIRHIVNALVKKLARQRNTVAEGRDMTTVVFPDAEYRFYLDASAASRAKRRFEQGVSLLSIDEIQRYIEERDRVDQNKPEGSLKRGEGVIYIDTSHLTIEQSYEKMVHSIQRKGQNMGKSDVELVESAGKEPDVPNDENQTQMKEEFLQSFRQLEEGQLVAGTIVQVTNDQVFVDVGYKSEGKIPLAEFSEVPQPGDAVSVIIVNKENKYGEVIVSKQKADEKILWKLLKQAVIDHTAVDGVIDKLVKGGYEVNLGGGISAFMPISQTDVQRIERPEDFLGLKIRALVERLYSEGKANVVVNRRRLIEEEIEKKRDEFFQNVAIGMEIDGVVKSFTSFGAFVDIGGFDGLLHINDMSWGHVNRPKDFVKKGQKINVKVLRIDPDERRINLSLKHFSDDPWVHFEDKYHVNDVVKGTVTKLAEFGAFIEIEEGIEGLAHISEFSWIKKIQKAEEVLKIGDEVDCMILGYDLQGGRVSLGLKQITENPWINIEERYPLGTRLKRKIVKITGAGAFIELEEGIDGFLHSEDISWTKKIKHIGNELSAGDEIEVMVTKIEPKSRNIRLGVKQLSEDPWKSFSESYRIGSVVEGEVSSVTDFGIFVKVPGGIEGLIHKNNLVENKDDNPDEALKKYKTGDPVKAVVLELQGDKQKLAFSIRDYQRKMQRDEISRYMAVEESDGSTFTLGDALKSKSASS
jgi:small subunit ribosomal protein S1